MAKGCSGRNSTLQRGDGELQSAALPLPAVKRRRTRLLRQRCSCTFWQCCLLIVLAFIAWPRRPSVLLFSNAANIRRSHARLVRLRATPQDVPGEAGKTSSAAGSAPPGAPPQEASAAQSEQAAAVTAALAEAAATSPLVAKWLEVKEEIAEDFQRIRDGRLGFFLRDQFLLDKSGEDSLEIPIYKRKYQTLGTLVTATEAMARATNRLIKKCKDSTTVREFVELVRSRLYLDDIDYLKRVDEDASYFLKEVVPEVRYDAATDSIISIVATLVLAGIVIALVACCGTQGIEIAPEE